MMFARRLSSITGLVILFILFGMALIFLSSQTYASPADLPPRPATPTNPTEPEPASTKRDSEKPVGGYIQLNVQSGRELLWTVVQWQDDQGNWHNADGWQGEVDNPLGTSGQKIWWVAQKDFGKGPFRWAVYDQPNTNLLGISDLFTLPQTANETVTTDLVITP